MDQLRSARETYIYNILCEFMHLVGTNQFDSALFLYRGGIELFRDDITKIFKQDDPDWEFLYDSLSKIKQVSDDRSELIFSAGFEALKDLDNN